MTGDRAPDQLRLHVLKGGRLLFARQSVGLVISLVGILALTRLIGPSAYGLYAAAFGIAFFVQATGELSLDVYLVRHPGDLPRERCDQVFTLLVLLAVIATPISIALVPIIASVAHLKGFSPVLLVMFLSLPTVHLQQVHLSRLERQFDYASIGIVELLAQATFFIVALPLAATKSGVWAPVAGWWAQQIVLLGGFWLRDPYRPAFIWRPAWIREILIYGAVTNSSNILYSLRNLVAPIFIGRELGAAAVGYVSLAIRLGQQLSFAQQVMSRISIAVLARVAHDRARLRRVMTQGAELELLSAGVPLAGFSLLAAPLVPLVFGHRWLPVASVVPLLALPYMAMALFSLLNSTIALQRRPWDLLVSQGTSAALLWIGALVFVPMYGIRGYGYAEIGATASWLVTDRLLARRVARPRYAVAMVWWAGLSAAALAPVTTWWLLAATVICFAVPASAKELRVVVLSVLRPDRAPAEVAP